MWSERSGLAPSDRAISRCRQGEEMMGCKSFAPHGVHNGETIMVSSKKSVLIFSIIHRSNGNRKVLLRPIVAILCDCLTIIKVIHSHSCILKPTRMGFYQEPGFYILGHCGQSPRQQIYTHTLHAVCNKLKYSLLFIHTVFG